MDKFSVKIDSTGEMVAARKLFKDAGIKLYHALRDADTMGGHAYIVYDTVDACRSHSAYGNINLNGVEELRAHLTKEGLLKPQRLTNFSVEISSDEDFVNVLAFLKEQGYPIFSGTLDAKGMDCYKMLGWNSDEVCRLNVRKQCHYTSIAAFMRDILSPDAQAVRLKAEKREELLAKVGAARATEHEAQLKASTATAARIKLEKELAAL